MLINFFCISIVEVFLDAIAGDRVLGGIMRGLGLGAWLGRQGSLCSPWLGRTVGGGGTRCGRFGTSRNIHLGSDDVANFCSKSGSEQKTQEGRPLPKRTDCTCKKTQDLMPSASRNHLKVL